MISPADITDKVMAVADLGVTHVTLARGVAVEPVGDLIQADVTREAANDVLADLTSLCWRALRACWRWSPRNPRLWSGCSSR